MVSPTLLQVLTLIFCALILVSNAENVADTNPSSLDYDLSPEAMAAAAAYYQRQSRGSYMVGPNGQRKLPWNYMIRPGMAGGYRKRVSEREINNLLKGTWLG